MAISIDSIFLCILMIYFLFLTSLTLLLKDLIQGALGCYPIFDIKATTLTQKGRFVAGGHTMYTSAAMMYASVVSRESVRIAFLVADLN